MARFAPWIWILMALALGPAVQLAVAQPARLPPQNYVSSSGPQFTPPDNLRGQVRQLGSDTSNLFEPAQIVARIGDQHVLAGDLLGHVNQVLEPYLDQAPSDELEQQRRLLMQRLLEQQIETKLLYLDFLRNIPAERVADIQQRLYDEFDKEELEPAMEKAKVDTPAELDAQLRRYGSSLKKQKRDYAERKLGRSMLGRNVDFDPEITHQEMLEYYRKHLKDYEIPARARWEQLMVRFDKFPTRAEAYRALAAMGNEVLRGAPLAAVAKRHSQGFNADEGGLHDWTTKGSLVSKVLDHAIFTLPEGSLSQILEDERGFHIIRVVERQEVGRTPFTEAQVEIKEKLRRQKVQKEITAYLERLRKTTPVWTIFDEEEDSQSAAGPQVARSGESGRR